MLRHRRRNHLAVGGLALRPLKLPHVSPFESTGISRLRSDMLPPPSPAKRRLARGAAQAVQTFGRGSHRNMLTRATTLRSSVISQPQKLVIATRSPRGVVVGCSRSPFTPHHALRGTGCVIADAKGYISQRGMRKEIQGAAYANFTCGGSKCGANDKFRAMSILGGEFSLEPMSPGAKSIFRRGALIDASSIRQCL